MKKYVVIVCCLLSVLFLSACSDQNKNKDIDVSQYKHYVDVTESYTVSSYNGFKCVDLKQVKNDDGSYTVTFNFRKVEINQ